MPKREKLLLRWTQGLGPLLSCPMGTTVLSLCPPTVHTVLGWMMAFEVKIFASCQNGITAFLHLPGRGPRAVLEGFLRLRGLL